MFSNRSARAGIGVLVVAIVAIVAFGAHASDDETRGTAKPLKKLLPDVDSFARSELAPRKLVGSGPPTGLEPDAPLQVRRRAVSNATAAAWDAFRAELGGTWNASWDATSGGPSSIVVLGTPVAQLGEDVENGARQLLLRHAALFGIDAPADLSLVGKHERSAIHLKFARTVSGVPVEGTEIGVNATLDGRLLGISGAWPSGLSVGASAGLSPAAAIESVLSRLGVGTAELPGEFHTASFSERHVLRIGPEHIRPAGSVPVGTVHNSWVVDGDALRPVWVVQLGIAEGYRSIEAKVDAASGGIVASRQLNRENHEPINVYQQNPDKGPIVSRTINDANKGTGGSLDGNWVTTVNDQAAEISSPPYDRTTDPNDPYFDLNFDEQNAFWVLQEASRFVVGLEGDSNIGGRNYDIDPINAVVHFVDAGNPDNNEGSFSPLFDQIQMGHGTFHIDPVFGLRDSALEDDFLMHEYGHRVGRDITSWSAGDSPEAMNEGMADHFAFMFTEDVYLGEFNDPEDEVGHESGLACCFNGFIRSALNARKYSDICDNFFVDPATATCRPAPDDSLCCESHSDGEIYAGVLWDVRLAYINAEGFADGTAKADQTAYEHLYNLAGIEDFIKGRDAVLSADASLYGGAHECLIWSAFAGREMGQGADNALPVPATSTTVPAQCQNLAEMRFDQGSYNCGSGQQARVEIDDANGGAVTSVTVTTDSGDSETFAVGWSGSSGQTAFFDIDVGGTTSAGNGVIEVTGAGDTIRASFSDDAPARVVTAGADIDCELNLQVKAWRVEGGSCDGDDPFLDNGESATLVVELENREVRSSLDGAALTLSVDNPAITINDPVTQIAHDLSPGDDLVLRYSLSGGALGQQDAVNFTLSGGGTAYSGGIRTPGAQTELTFADVGEADLLTVENSNSWDFNTAPAVANPVSCSNTNLNPDDWCTSANGADGTETFNWFDVQCAGKRPEGADGGYWLQGDSTGTNCSGNPNQQWNPEYAASDSTWLVSPLFRIHEPAARFPSQLTRIEWRQNVELGDEAGFAPFIQGDLFYLPGGQISQATSPITVDNNTVGWEDADPDGDAVPGSPILLSAFGAAPIDLSNGRLRVRLLFVGDDGALPDPSLNGEDGIYIDDLSIFWDEFQVGNDATASCPAADSSLSLVAHAFDDTDPAGGNANGVLDPGETVQLQVRLLGGGTESSRNIVGNLSSDQPGLLTIGDAQATWPAIVPGEEELSDAPHFEVTVDPSTPCGTIFWMTLSLDHNGVGGKSVVNFPLRVGVFAPDASPFVAEDFESGPGSWTVDPGGTDTATAGVWELVDPELVCYGDQYDPLTLTYSQDCGQSTPGQNPPAARQYQKTVTPGDDDNPGTSTGMAWITENTTLDENFNLNDVDGGETTIGSSDYDISTLNDPTVSYARHYYSREGFEEDSLDVEISTDGGGSWITLEHYFARYGIFSEDDGDPDDFDDGPLDGGWTTRSFNLLDMGIQPTATTRFRVRVRDEVVGASQGQIVEAGFDDLEIRENVGGSCTPFAGGGNTPGEASRAGAPQMLVTGFDAGTGDITISYEPACSATDHTVVYGDLADVSTYGWSGQECAAGTSGSVTFNPSPNNAFWVIVGNDGTVEGSYGEDGTGAQRPEAGGLPGCDFGQDLSNTCD